MRYVIMKIQHNINKHSSFNKSLSWNFIWWLQMNVSWKLLHSQANKHFDMELEWALPTLPLLSVMFSHYCFTTQVFVRLKSLLFNGQFTTILWYVRIRSDNCKLYGIMKDSISNRYLFIYLNNKISVNRDAGVSCLKAIVETVINSVKCKDLFRTDDVQTALTQSS